MFPRLTERATRHVDDSTCDTNNQNNQPSMRLDFLLAAVVLIIVGTAGFLVVFAESVLALQGVYQWYPQFVAQQWFIYDELFTIFTFSGLFFGSLTASLILSSTNRTLITGLLCTISGASVSVTSLIAPLAVLWKSVLYYFLPLFLAPLVGTLLFYHAKLIR